MRFLALLLLMASACTPPLQLSDASTDGSDVSRDVDRADGTMPTDSWNPDTGDVPLAHDASPFGDLQITTVLQIDHPTVMAGDTLRATVTYTNVGLAPLDVRAIVITARPPGGTHAGGPFANFAPEIATRTVAPGESVVVDASRAFTGADSAGTWEIYSTWQDSAMQWHDGPSASFMVAASAHPMAPNGYYVVGNTIYNAAGQPHLFHGVDRPSLESSSTGYMLSAADYQAMASWGARVVRIALCQDYWLPGAALYTADYATRVDQNITWAHAAGLDVILDLHWTDHGDLSNTAPGQQRMADANSIPFWQSVATRYQGDGRVIFELYNEPHDISWDVWLNGGDTGDGFTAAGMQQLYDAVRGTGAENLVIIGGNQWSYDLSGVPTHRVVGHNIAYATHPYDWPGESPTDWMASWGFLAATDPVIATEFGNSPNSVACSTPYYSSLIAFADAHNVSWTAWAWWVGGCTFPPLLADWSGTPNDIGTVVQNALRAYP